MSRGLSRTIIVSALCLASTAALGQGLSTDIELVRPTLSPAVPPGIDGAAFDPDHRTRAGVFAWYTRNPVVLEFDDLPDAPVVANRLTLLVGTSWEDRNSRFGLRLTAPAAGQWGSQSPDFGSDGVRTGDVRGGARVRLAGNYWVAAAAHVDVSVPTGTAAAWMGGRPEIRAGLSGQALGERGGLALDLGVLGRAPSEVPDAVRVSSALQTGIGLRQAVLDPVFAQAEWIGQVGIAPLAGAGSAASEVLAGAGVQATETVLVDAMVGHGLGNGVGTTDARILLGITTTSRPPPAAPAIVEAPAPVVAPEPIFDVVDVEVPLPPSEPACPELFVEAPEPEPEPPAEAAVWVARERIEIRDEIQFEVGTRVVLAPSVRTLDEVAALLDERPDLAHVVIVGHASEEGSFAYNYTLSLDRATAVFEALVRAGVHPARLSIRAMGEVQPHASDATRADLAANRRVEFRIEHQLAEGEPIPQHPPLARHPWDGARTATPSTPPPSPDPDPGAPQ